MRAAARVGTRGVILMKNVNDFAQRSVTPSNHALVASKQNDIATLRCSNEPEASV
jgi:hypothetical protein